MPSLAGLRCFLEVAASGSFAEASRRLGLSTSATSKAVARLEDELGVRLLHRTTRRVSLTPEGERVRDGAASPVGELEALAAELADGLAGPRGRLAITVPAAWGRVWLTPRLPRFLARYPAVRLELSLADRAADLAGEGFDVAVRTGPLGDSQSLVARRLFGEPMVTCASPAYLAERGIPQRPDDLAAHDCLNHRTRFTGRPYPWRFAGGGDTAREWPVEGRFICDDGEAVARAAIAGVGISQMPLFLAESALADGRLVELLVRFRPSPMAHTAFYLNRRLVAPRVRAFLDFLIHEARARVHAAQSARER